MRITSSYNKNNKNKNVIVYGAGRYGELAYWGLKNIGITPKFFVDKSIAGQKYFGVDVITPEEINNYPDAAILIASLNYFYEMLSYVQSLDHEEVYDILDIIRLNYDDSVLTEYVRDEKHNYEKYQNVVENTDSHKLIINHCEVVITECCTLRCKDCANLMQYYVHPEIFDMDEVIKYFDRFLDSIDLLLDMRILGGEPFIHKEISKLIDRYKVNDKIKRITIYTNSTLIPDDKVIESLKSEKVAVHMSNYGAVSRHVEALDTIFGENGIKHYIHKYDKWYDLGGIEKRGFSENSLKKIYQTCLMANCLSFYRGKLFTCPRAGHGEQLGFFKVSENEFVDFTVEKNSDDRRNQIRYVVESLEYITACDYCNGSSSRSKEIDAAIQMVNKV